MRLREFYRPNIFKVSFAFLCLGLTFLFIVPLSAHVPLIPCRLAEGAWSMCPLHPDPNVTGVDALYLGWPALDYAYQLLYAVIMILVIPYTLSCFIFKFYYSYIKKLVR